MGLAIDSQHMAGEEIDVKRSSRRKHSSISHKSHKSHGKHHATLASIATSDRPPTLDALRKARLDYLETPPEERRTRMKYVYDQQIPPESRSTKEKDRRSTVSVARLRSEEPRKRQKRREGDNKDAHSDDGYVYTRPEEGKEERRSGSGSKSRSRDHLGSKAATSKPASSKATVKRDLPRRNTEPPRPHAQRRSSCPPDDRLVLVSNLDLQATNSGVKHYHSGHPIITSKTHDTCRRAIATCSRAERHYRRGTDRGLGRQVDGNITLQTKGHWHLFVSSA